MSKPVTVITGASSGIGTALARVFAARGHDLVLCARRESRLDELAEELRGETVVTIVPADLSAMRGPQSLHKAIVDAGLEIDVLVNNAGVGMTSRFKDMPRSKIADIVNVNVRALTELTHLFLPAMIARGSGRILNVASVAAFRAVPSMAVYSASKAYVLSFTESLSEELRGTNVTVTALCPGLTKTEMVKDLEAVNVPEFLMARAEDVAQEGYQACMSGEVIRVPGVMNQALVNWLELQPRWLVRTLSGFVARSTLTNEPRGSP
jgi:uncharacterized protein